MTVTIDLGLQGAAEPVAPVPEQDDTSRLTFDTRHQVLSPLIVIHIICIFHSGCDSDN